MSTANTGERRTIDLTDYDYAYRPAGPRGYSGHITCWTVPPGGKPRPDDLLILRNGERTSRYRVRTVSGCWNVDPPTMWMADVDFAPRMHAEVER